MLQEIRELGFEWAELSHGIRISLLPGIFQAVEAGEIKISTLHNFCPLPMGIDHAAPNVYQFSSIHPRERENAFRHTLKTIEVAANLNAPVVVLHLGSIDSRDYQGKLAELVKKGQRDTPRYSKLCDEVLAKLEERKETPFSLVKEALTNLAAEAEKKGIRLGIENRESIEELPMDGDFHFLMKEFTQKSIGYWHDTGHAQIKENLGFIHHQMHLQSMSSRLLGFHIHDVHAPDRDHRIPGTGCVDFESLKEVVRPDHIKVFEFSPSLSPEEAKQGVEYIYKTWGH